MRRYTSYADRQEIVMLREAGDSYRAIARKTGWSFEVVGKICRAYQKRSQAALQPKRPGRPGSGPLSSFDPLVKYACLRIKCQHARGGPDVVLSEMALISANLGIVWSTCGDIGNYRRRKNLNPPYDLPIAVGKWTRMSASRCLVVVWSIS